MLLWSILGQCQERTYICQSKNMWVIVYCCCCSEVHWAFFFESRERLLSPRRLTWSGQHWFHVQNPPFVPLQPLWQLHPPQGKLINYGWMFDWQRLNDRSSVLTQLPHTENLVPIVLFKTCQMITEKLLFTQLVELFPLTSVQDICMFVQMIPWRMKLNIMG